MQSQENGYGIRLSSIPGCAGQAYACLWHYFLPHVVISLFAFLPFCLAGYFGYLAPVFTASTGQGAVPEGFHLSFLLLMFTTFFWAIPSLILWHRLFLLGPEHLIRPNFWPLMTRSLHYIAKFLILLGGIVLLTFVLTAFLLFLLNNILSFDGSSVAEIGKLEMALYIGGVIFVFLFTFMIALRLSLAFSAQAIGKKLGFRASWTLTRQHTGHMVLSALLSLLPAALVVLSASYVLDRLFEDPSRNLYLVLFMLAPVLSLPLAVFCSQTSVYYRGCGACHHREEH